MGVKEGSHGGLSVVVSQMEHLPESIMSQALWRGPSQLGGDCKGDSVVKIEIQK